MPQIFRIAVMSDIHLEFEHIPGPFALHAHPEYGWPAISEQHLRVGPDLVEAQKTKVDLVLIAGDTSNSWKLTAKYIQLVASYFGVPTVAIIGNHEAYDTSSYDEIVTGLDEALNKGRSPEAQTYFLEAAYSSAPVHVELTIKGRQLLILGSCLWTDFSLWGLESQGHAKERIRDGIRDFETCYLTQTARLTVDDTEQLHRQAIARFESILADKRQEQELILLTHMAPSPTSLARLQHADRFLATYYASDMEDWMKQRAIRLWVHGHIHDELSYRVGKTEIVCAARGYPHQGPRAVNFEPCVIEI